MSGSAEFPTSRFELAGAGKLQLRLADRPRQNFHVIFRAFEIQRVDRVRTRDTQMNRNSGGNQNAVGNKQILLRDHAHRHRAVASLLGSQIALHELARQMQRKRIHRQRPFQKPYQRYVDLVVARGRNQAQKKNGEQKRSQLSPIHNVFDPRHRRVPHPCAFLRRVGILTSASALRGFKTFNDRRQFLSAPRCTAHTPSDNSYPRPHVSNNSSSARTSSRPPSSLQRALRQYHYLNPEPASLRKQ